MNVIDMKCAPSKKFADGSCFSLESLRKIASAYNKKNPNKSTHINTNMSKNKLVEAITNVFKNKCNDQACWLRDEIVLEINDNEIHENTFRPEGPDGKYAWLSTLDINNVITQYHEIHKDFLFLGAVPYDFEELPVLELHHDNLFNTYYNDGKHRIGMVINLDTHNMSGSHWVALYANLHNNQVYFFDSVGKKPGKRIRKFVNKIVKYLYNKDNPNQKLNINSILNRIKNNKNSKIQQLNNIDIKYNYIQHQFDNSECGVYSINFILRLIDGESFENIITNITRDEAMNTNRLVYFR